MLPRWFPYLNAFLIVIIVLAAACCLYMSMQEVPSAVVRITPKKELPPHPFSVPNEVYQEIGEGPLALNWVTPQMQLPNLQDELLFYGRNERPDTQRAHASFHIMTRSDDQIRSVHEGERIYLVYQGTKQKKYPADSKGLYSFSPYNQPTALSIKLHTQDEHTVQIEVNMLDEKGETITTPEPFHHFSLFSQEDAKTSGNGWNLGKFRVDSTLLVRQKARWMGRDRFLELHGGEEYAYAQGRQRIDFNEEKVPYSCFVKEGDLLIWKNERWKVLSEKEESRDFPLLVVKKIDEKVLTFELWDAIGRSKTSLNLLHLKDHEKPLDLNEEFKFVGAKTWAQFLVECRGSGRLVVRTNDWIVCTQEGWKKLDSAEEVDAYLDSKLSGPLFVIDKLTRENGRQVLLGHLFNKSRTDVEEIKLIASGSSNHFSTNHYAEEEE